YKRLRVAAPVVRVPAVGRTLLTKAADTRYVKDNPLLFSSSDPGTPMERAFQAKTLMRRDGADHLRLRNAMRPTFSARNIKDVWVPAYTQIAHEYVSRLPRGEVVDLFSVLAAPVAARCLGHVMGIQSASDEDLQLWSQTLIDGAGNFGLSDELFARSDAVNVDINACISSRVDQYRAEPDQSALSIMLNEGEPLEMEHIVSNIKIAIGGGINEPRDALLSALFGLLNNPEQKQAAVESGDLWDAAFEEAIRWVAPIQISSRLVKEDTKIRGCLLPKGDVVMTIQASANHDEELYTDAHLFDLFRSKAAHQAFGNGPHFCLGTHIARRLIGGILLPMLFDRFPNMQLETASDVVWSGFAFRGPLNLPVRLE
ncbi:MAG: cytochrome P450, partial [Planctomycetota bacterium]